MALTKLTKPRARWATFKLSVADAVLRSLYDKILDNGVSGKDFGAVGDGIADDTRALELLFSYGGRVKLHSGTYRVSRRINLSNGTKVIGEGHNSTFILAADKVSGDLTTMIGTSGTSSNLVTDAGIHGVTLDANFKFQSCAFMSWMNSCSFEDIKVRNPLKQLEENYRGGFLVLKSSFVHINKFRAYGIYQHDDISSSEYQSLSFTDSHHCWVKDSYVTQSDKAYHVGGESSFIHFSEVEAVNTRNNGLYLIEDVSNITFNGFLLKATQEGIVLNADGKDRGIVINDGTISESTSRALALRSGEGYQLSNISVYKCYSGMAQSTNTEYSGVKNLQATNITIKGCTTERPLYLARNKNISISNLKILDAPTFIGNDVCRIAEDCDDISITDLYIDTRSNPLLYGIYIAPEAGGSPNITVDGYEFKGITRDFVTQENSADTLFARGKLGQYNGTVRVIKDEGGSIGILSQDASVGAGQSVGEFYHEQSDSSGLGAGKVFSVKTSSLTSVGSTYQTEIYGRDTELVSVIKGGTMTIVLPTSPTGLPSGAIWNDSGTIRVVG
ncbi:hypothetical protein [Vibrio phage vB_ValA_R15Z]|uniref:Rhamnogalacturonase A/B/Epimerase-like pectate lyase domain-containing protein n=1 Tax=Vibrio phage vB_ValA_R15Z TaxID=3044218 RepID=A0AA50AEG3_9CAUD|nr:hypothetical protein [Vibrio phage vB_ValA_R15Z]